ncbi:Homeobox B-H1 [Gossypium arboreum]|uniref:Homeobox B-H1 n=1 Tax=Gossypium arboreum TaxID=29729 RepID=A0A0B0PEA8_GOSAR|nr:Homeobox B-H1 [Gossypium arboreum]
MMCLYKTMSGTWQRHRYVGASVRPCLGHGIDLTQCKTMSRTWHRLNMRASVRP